LLAACGALWALTLASRLSYTLRVYGFLLAFVVPGALGLLTDADATGLIALLFAALLAALLLPREAAIRALAVIGMLALPSLVMTAAGALGGAPWAAESSGGPPLALALGAGLWLPCAVVWPLLRLFRHLDSAGSEAARAEGPRHTPLDTPQNSPSAVADRRSAAQDSGSPAGGTGPGDCGGGGLAAAELERARQLRYAEAVAGCSRTLLVEGAATAAIAPPIRKALAALRSALGCSWLSLSLYQGPDELMGAPSFYVADQDSERRPFAERGLDPRDFSAPVVEAIADGELLVGTPRELCRAESASHARLEASGARSVLVGGLLVGGLWRGYLVAGDTGRGPAWGDPERLLLRIVLEMLAAFLERGESTATLRTREELLRAAQVRQAGLQAALERARDEAEATARARSAVLADMSHEIRTPLNAVIGVGDLLLDTVLSSEQRELAALIVNAGQQLLAVVNNILDFSRIDAGHLTLEDQPFDLLEVLQGSLGLVEHTARQKSLALRLAADPDLPRVIMGDGARLRQVLLNLLSNAVKFTASGEVVLRASAQPAGDGAVRLRLAVQDTGIGIAPEQHEQIFAPFVQADSSTARRYGGTGLGLAICRQLVLLMGGQIELDSTPGVGSTFTCTLTVRLAALEAPAASPEAEPQPGESLRVLIVEDNLINQQVNRQLVARMGHAVTVVEDGYAALDALAAAPYDLVLMDVQMPGLDGIETTRRIRELGAQIRQPRIAALTANALSGDRERFLAAGMDDYLSKPVELPALRRALNRGRASVEPAADVDEAGLDPNEAAPLIDWPMLTKLMDSFGLPEREAVALIMALFDQEIPGQLHAIAAAIVSANNVALYRYAHRLCGGCLQIGARAMAQLCRQLERAAPAYENAATAAKLLDCYDATRALLRERLSQEHQP
jgi:signal transduction histidine kinase/CheY-like chemotaxis protein